MLITKKRLENMVTEKPHSKITKSDDLCDIARKWGMVSTEDPNQGFHTTPNNWVKYIHTYNQ